MNKKIALITGANRGLGLEIARQLGHGGVTVLLAARTLAKAEKAAAILREEQINCHGLELDVTNSEHIAAITKVIEKEYGQLDILINNAGIFLDHLGSSLDVMRQTFEVNVFGAHTLTEALLPLLKASPAGRIVNQSSIMGSVTTILADSQLGDSSRPAYSSSKAALNMLTALLSVQLKETNVKVNATHPGWVKTDLGGENAPMDIEDGAKTAVRLATLPDDGPTGGYFHNDEALPW
ncbi:SDR family oxidoreductase [Paenibacillus sp. SYP-B3998]|uniref:SDR family oxidoreductase n=1 Tax=Paenibacillus sp. SYP-B3998 TaxID=2678564 RepID=A0A6G4A400_9BACL|nr:SDR family oxidoreductase [Paenibacillus sp. SYP-B3998]NEW08377.1 SDR family oxidoreductase [Paenibacillus sp. SYP-B3998]